MFIISRPATHTRNPQMAHRFSMMHDTMNDVSEKRTSAAAINRRESNDGNMFLHRAHRDASPRVISLVNGFVMNLTSFFLESKNENFLSTLLLTDSIVSWFILEKGSWADSEKQRERKRDFRKISFHQQLFSYLSETIGRSSAVK